MKNKKGIAKVNKPDIRKDFLISPTLFRNLITPLSYMGIILYKEDDRMYEIALLGMPEHV